MSSHQLTPDQVAMLFVGTEVYGIGTIAKLYAIGAPEICFICKQEGALTQWLRERGCQIEIFSEPTGLGMRPGLGRVGLLSTLYKAKNSAKSLQHLIRKRGIRIIHTHYYGNQLIAGNMRPFGYLSVWQINNYINRGWLFGSRRRIHQRIANWGADLLLPASDFVCHDWVGSRVPQVVVRNAALPLYDRPNQLPPSPVRCLVAGRLVPDKGHHNAVEAVIAARDAGLDVRLDICGDPINDNDYADQLRNLASRAGHSDAIRLLGFQDDLRQRHQDYHLGLQCRIDPEPCSLWVCEAMVDGLPLIASSSGGTPELVNEGDTGLLFSPGDAKDLTEKLISLASEPSRLDAMRRAAFELGKDYFSIDRFIRETFEAYSMIFA